MNRAVIRKAAQRMHREVIEEVNLAAKIAANLKTTLRPVAIIRAAICKSYMRALHRQFGSSADGMQRGSRTCRCDLYIVALVIVILSALAFT